MQCAYSILRGLSPRANHTDRAAAAGRRILVPTFAGNAHASYYIHICGLSGSTIFFHILSQTVRFLGKETLNIKCVFWFSPQILSGRFLILRRTERDTPVFMYDNPYSCQIYWKLEFLGQIFEKSNQIISHGNNFSGSRFVPCGRTQTDEVNSCFFAILSVCLKKVAIFPPLHL